MNKLLILLTLLFPLIVQADLIQGPVGDVWDNGHQLIINNADGPLYLTSETYIKAESIVINRSIVTNGFGLTIESRELSISPEVEIKTFDRAYTAETFVNESLKFTTPAGNFCSVTGTASNEVGLNGESGRPGLHVLKDPQPIRIYSTMINGTLKLLADGQQGGKGGKGGTAGKGKKGCKGRDGDASCSGLAGWGDGNSRDGETGKNGARGGYGGKGGKGGHGGMNAQISLSYLNYHELDNSVLSSRVGLGGHGGEPGDNGLSGDPGDGGDGDKKECGYWPNEHTVKASAGKAGKQIALVENDKDREKRRGAVGDTGKELVDAIKLNKFTELKLEREKVVTHVTDFHFTRSFYQLVQQTLMIVLNKDSSELFTDFSQINERARLKLIRDWKVGFIDAAEKESNNSLSLKSILTISKEVVSLLEGLTIESKESSLDLVNQILKQYRSLMTAKIRQISSSCRSFLAVDAENLLERTELFAIPLCDELQKLTSNPMASLELSRSIKVTVGGLKEDDYSLGSEITSREPSSDFEVIIISNNKFGKKHFVELYSLSKRESISIGAIRNLGPISSGAINLNNLGAYLRLMRAGMQE